MQRFASEGAGRRGRPRRGRGGAEAAAVDGMFVRADVTSSDEVEALYAEVAARFGGSICCNNAGISPPDDDSILDTGSTRRSACSGSTSRRCTSAAGARCPACWPAARGRSSTPRRSSPSWVATSQVSYTASKGGVLAMSRELGVQFARQGWGQRAVPGAGQHAVAGGAARRIQSGRPGDWCTSHGALRPGHGVCRRVRFSSLPTTRPRDGDDVPRRRGISGAYVTPL